MKQLAVEEGWSECWKSSFEFDRLEIYGDLGQRGYAYAYDNRRRQTLSLISEVLPPGATVLDIAGAQGNFSLALAERGYVVTWNDLRAELVDYVKLKHEHGEVHFAPGNAFELSFPAPFDAVLVTEVIEHVAHPDKFLDKVAQLVKPGGYVIMTTPNGRYFRNTLPKFSECQDPGRFEAQQFKPDADGHIFLLHPDEVPSLARQAGLEVDALALFTNPLTNGHVKTEALLRVMKRHWVDALETLTQRLPARVKPRLLVQMGVRFRKPGGPIASAAEPGAGRGLPGREGSHEAMNPDPVSFRQVAGLTDPPDSALESRTMPSYGWSSQAPHSCSYLAPQVLKWLGGLGVRRVLDLGAGNGSLCGLLHATGYDTVGMEPDVEGIGIARRAYPEVPFHCFGVQNEPTDLLTMEPAFDVVVSTEVIEHLFAPRQLPRFAAGVLKEGGHLIITTPYHGYLKNLALSVMGKWDDHHTALWQGGHIKFWSRRTLTRLLSDNGFEVIAFHGVGRLPFLWKSMALVARKR